MRIALIGDLQYWMPHEENLAYKMKQVAALKPDFAVMMGDFGGSMMRKDGGYRETKEHLDLLGCPWQPILGNHDVEYAADYCNDFDPFETCRREFGKDPRCSFVVNGVLVICITIERQPLETMRTIHAVYVSNEQYEWVRAELSAHIGMPTVIIAHAPVAGSGLRCDRPLHCAALDTFLDHTFDFERWPRLLREFPQIAVWCSAHLHMGHDYDTSITEKDGVVHISCGVMTCCSRDEEKHTRILDITDDKRLIVSTLDHNGDPALLQDALIDLKKGSEPRGRFARPVHGEMLLGFDTPIAVWSHESKKRCFIATEKGLLWEYLTEYNEFSGALALEKKITALHADGDRLYMTHESGVIEAIDLDSRMRWDWDNLLSQEADTVSEARGTALDRLSFTTRTAKEGTYVNFADGL